MNLLKKVHNCKLPGESMSESWAPVDSCIIYRWRRISSINSVYSCLFHLKIFCSFPLHFLLQALLALVCANAECSSWVTRYSRLHNEKKNMMKRWNDNVKSWVLKRFLNTTQVNKLPQEILHAILGIYLCQRAINLCPHKKNSKHWKCRNALEKQKVPTKLTLQRLASEFSTTTRRAKMLSKCSSGLWRIKTSGFITSVPKETAIGNHSRKS